VAKAFRCGSLALTLALLAAILICALAPSPNMREMAWIPGWIGEWADRTPNFRNMPVFAALSALLCFVVTLYQPLVTRHGRWRIAFGVFVATGLLGIALEALQLLLPHRWADWVDVFWSVAGAFFGALVAWIVARLSPVF
jgi:glycopeptide antibiotics resistance protein